MSGLTRYDLYDEHGCEGAPIEEVDGKWIKAADAEAVMKVVNTHDAALRASLADETAIVDRVWKALGVTTYAQVSGKAIDTIVAELRAENTGLKQQTSVYKDKHAYQWHDLYTTTLAAWHKEVDGLKAENERLTQQWHAACTHDSTVDEVAALRATIEELNREAVSYRHVIAANQREFLKLEAECERLKQEAQGQAAFENLCYEEVMRLTWLLVLHMLNGDVPIPLDLPSETRCKEAAVIAVLMLVEKGFEFRTPTFSCTPQMGI